MEHFVAGFHVGEVEVSKHVAHKGQEFVADGVPEKQNPVRVLSLETGAVDHIGKAFFERF